jgi:hypothetical protein
MLSTLSGLGGQPLTLKADPNVPLNTSGVSQDVRDRMRPSINNINMGPTFRQEGDMARYVAFNDPGQPGAGFSNYQDYLDAGNSPVTGPIRGPLLGGAMIPEQGPLGSGLVGGIPSVPEGGAPKIGGPAIMPPNNTGIGSLTQNPINTTPESVTQSSITGSMSSSGYLNNNQDLDQYLNSYVENLINRRMRDLFSGIMSIFQ